MIPLLVAAIGALALSPSLVELHRVWTDPDRLTYNHGYAVAAIAVWLVIRRGTPGSNRASNSGFLALLLLLGAGIAWCLAELASVQLVALALVPALLWLAICSALGLRAGRSTVLPFLLLLTAMPFMSLFNGFFQWATIFAARGALSLAGFPVLFDGNAIRIPEGIFEIADGCSGLRYVIIGITFSALVGELRDEPLRRRIELVLLALAIVMVGNWLRVITIILAGHFSYMQSPLVADHRAFGWVVFALAIALFLLVEKRLPDRRNVMPVEAAAPRAIDVWSGLRPAPLVATFAVLGFTAGLHALASRPTAPALPSVQLPSGWQAINAVQTGWRPRFEGVDAEEITRFGSSSGGMLDLYRAAYVTQQQGKEFRSPNNDPEGVLTKPADERSVVAVDYRVGGLHFERALFAQTYFAWESLLQLRSAPAQIVVYRAVCAGDCQSASRQVSEFTTLNN